MSGVIPQARVEDQILPSDPERAGTIDVEMTSTDARVTKEQADPFLVSFEVPSDKTNPLDWPRSKKWTVTDVLSATGFNRIMVSTIMAPALPLIARDLNMSDVESVMALSIYILATAFGPPVMGPLSEVYGRRPVLHASNIWFLVWNLVCGFANSKGLLISARFLAGFGASAIYALAGGVLGDVWRPEQRGKSLGIYLLIPLLGAAVGPIIGGFMAGRATWRWMFWSTSIFQGVMVALSLVAFKETHAPTILRNRARRLRKQTGDDRHHTAFEQSERDTNVLRVLSRSLSRPPRLLLTHPMIQITAVVSGLYYGILYIVLATFSNLWITQYNESVEISGLHYIACAIGEVAGSQIGGPIMDKIFAKLKNRADGEIAPEFHLPLAIVGALTAPIGLFVYGWASNGHVFWIVPDVGVFFTTFGMQITTQPLQAYVIDSYPNYASSATAASQFVRSLTAFTFPLFAPQMYAALGYGWGNSLLALLALGIGVPAPILLWKYGARLRAKAPNNL